MIFILKSHKFVSCQYVLIKLVIQNIFSVVCRIYLVRVIAADFSRHRKSKEIKRC